LVVASKEKREKGKKRKKEKEETQTHPCGSFMEGEGRTTLCVLSFFKLFLFFCWFPPYVFESFLFGKKYKK